MKPRRRKIRKSTVFCAVVTVVGMYFLPPDIPLWRKTLLLGVQCVVIYAIQTAKRIDDER